MSDRLSRIAFSFELKAAAETGEFEGYASIFGNKDMGGDIVAPGAFAKALKARGVKGVKMLADHDPRQRVGVWEEMREDDRGLYVRGRLLIEKSNGKDAYIDLKSGALDGLSIGGRTMSDTVDGRKRARIIKEFDLCEISLVPFPMNEMARVSSVKSFDVDVIRALEADLRKDLNLSSAQAVSVVAIVKKHLREGGDIHPADASREADAKAIADLTARFRAVAG
jgi:uncharacterized protein